MKHFYAFAALCFAALTANAEINPDYSAPTQLSVQYFEGHAHLYFLAPAEGGVIYAPEFSYEKGLDGVQQLGDGDAWGNAGNGSEISTGYAVGSMTTHAATLQTAALSLEAGVNYALNFQAAGSRSSNNQQISVSLYRGETLVKEIIAPVELAPSLGYAPLSASFSVEEAAEDYTLRFAFEASTKTCSASLKQIVLESPIPEGRGALTGYALWRNGEQVATYAVSEVEQDRLYLTVTDAAELDEATTYTYALQALYEGGESPLTAAVTVETPDAISAVTLTATPAAYDLFGRRTAAPHGLQIVNGVKVVK